MGFPFKKYNFIVLINGMRQGRFSEIMMKNNLSEAIELFGDPVSMTDGRHGYTNGNIIIKGGISETADFTSWIKQSGWAEKEYRIVEVQLLSDDRNAECAAAWELVEARPFSVLMNEKTNGQEAEVEFVEFSIDYLIRIK